jgi:hypothetical protein
MPVFLDFEASSLNKASYPIEVGFVRADGTGEAYLIAPPPDWTDWDSAAERLHGLSRTRLFNEGLSPQAVVANLLPLFAADRVFASAPSWDGHWLSMLLRAAGLPRHLVRLSDSDIAHAEAAGLAPGPEADALIAEVRASLNAAPVVHRALPDARRDYALYCALRDRRRPGS